MGLLDGWGGGSGEAFEPLPSPDPVSKLRAQREVTALELPVGGRWAGQRKRHFAGLLGCLDHLPPGACPDHPNFPHFGPSVSCRSFCAIDTEPLPAPVISDPEETKEDLLSVGSSCGPIYPQDPASRELASIKEHLEMLFPLGGDC